MFPEQPASLYSNSAGLFPGRERRGQPVKEEVGDKYEGRVEIQEIGWLQDETTIFKGIGFWKIKTADERG